MAKRNGFDKILAKFESAVSKARPVICRPLLEMQRLATSDNEIYATYYQLLAAGVRLPKGDKWDVLRAVADDALFPGYKDVLRFGALSLDGFGCLGYGECHLENSGGGPQMVEISRDGRRVYATNSLYASWDEVFYPDGVGAWMAKLDADVSAAV